NKRSASGSCRGPSAERSEPGVLLPRQCVKIPRSSTPGTAKGQAPPVRRAAQSVSTVHMVHGVHGGRLGRPVYGSAETVAGTACRLRSVAAPSAGAGSVSRRASRREGGCFAPERRGRWLGGVPPRAVRPARGG